MTNDILTEFNNSFKFDRRIFAADIRVSLSYCDALFGAGVFTRLESERVKNGLQAILKRADYDKNYFHELPSEDIHSFIETRLVQLVGETGRKLRAGRSRIDQAATAFRLWLREEIEEISKFIRDLQKTLIVGGLGAIAGVWGMNFEVEYFKWAETGFWMTMLAMGLYVLGAILLGKILRWF